MINLLKVENFSFAVCGFDEHSLRSGFRYASGSFSDGAAFEGLDKKGGEPIVATII